MYPVSWYVWSVRFWLLIPEINTSRKSMEWFICFSIVNLMLRCLLFKKSKKVNESCSLSKAARMSSSYLKWNLGLLRLYSLSHLDSWKPMKMLAGTGAKGEAMATPSIWL